LNEGLVRCNRTGRGRHRLTMISVGCDSVMGGRPGTTLRLVLREG
jgi:hypothetical protein